MNSARNNQVAQWIQKRNLPFIDTFGKPSFRTSPCNTWHVAKQKAAMKEGKMKRCQSSNKCKEKGIQIGNTYKNIFASTKLPSHPLYKM